METEEKEEQKYSSRYEEIKTLKYCNIATFGIEDMELLYKWIGTWISRQKVYSSINVESKEW